MAECHARLLRTYKDREGKLLLLPIPTSRDGVHVSGSDLSLESLLPTVEEGTLVAGYGIPRSFSEAVKSRGGVLYDAGADEDFLKANAEITARGALGRILTLTELDAPELFVGIIGYGRIGAALSRLLLFLGARVRVYSRRLDTRLELSAAGIDARETPTAESVSELDILVNTAPTPIFDEEGLSRVDAGVRIVELASGKNFPDSERVLRLPSVPDKMYPITAGRLYAEYIERSFSLGGGGE